MIINGNKIKDNYVKASYIIRKNSSDKSIEVYADDTFVSFNFKDDFDPRSMDLKDTINLKDHINWDVSLEHIDTSYIFDISKDLIELTRLEDNKYTLKVSVTNPDMICSYPEGKSFDDLSIDVFFSFVYEDIKCMLTSCMDMYDDDEDGNKIPKHFGNKNHILDNIKKYVKKYDNFLFIASAESSFKITDYYANATFESFNLTLPFKNYNVLDSRTVKDIDTLISEADLIFLCGGHVPTQNEFFNKINLKEKIRHTHAFIIGSSAGSMNTAEVVYSPPELVEEASNPNFNRYYEGLGLTHINIFPHYDELQEEILDGKHVIKELVLPDSYNHDIYALNNGSYILITDNVYLYGEIYLFRDGIIKKINKDNESKVNKSWRV